MINFTIERDENIDVYQFGSSLYSDTPEDIDIAIIYNKQYVSIDRAIQYRTNLVNQFSSKNNIEIDTILLSVEEEEETDFLINAKHQLI